jgi:thiamine transporter
MLPISIFAYAFGLAPALLVGLIYGLLQFIQNPYIFSYATFLLDFLLAFSSIAMMPIIKKLLGDKKYTPAIAICFVFLVRFIFHFMSGLIYFDNGGIWANLPQDNAFIYSFLYQITYLLPDLVVNLIVLIPLIKTNKFELLLKYMNKNK